jgi:hypothetical protein
MTELQVTETSGDQPAAAAPEIIGDTLTVDSKDGRKLTLIYPGPLAQYDLVNALGAEASENGRLVRMYLPLIYLSAIDGEPIYLPTTLLQARALIGRLGHKGLAALQKGVKVFDERDEKELAEEAKK